MKATLQYENQVSQKYYYQAFGLNIASEIEFPMLHSVTHNFNALSKSNIDISIQLNKISNLIPHLQLESQQWIAKIADNKILVNISEVVCCLVENANTIHVEPVAGVPIQDIRLYLQAIVMVVLLYQKSIAPIHACGIVHNNKCHIFAGDSGIGKSTLAGAFFKRGFRIVCDDLCILRKNSQDEYEVYPGYPQIKLWKASLEKLEIPYDNLTQIYSREDKYYLPIPNWDTTPVPLGSINFLSTVEKQEITVQPLKTLDKFIILRNNLFRPYLVDMLNMHQPVFELTQKLVKQAPLHIIERPQEGFMLDELVDHLTDNVMS